MVHCIFVTISLDKSHKIILYPIVYFALVYVTVGQKKWENQFCTLKNKWALEVTSTRKLFLPYDGY